MHGLLLLPGRRILIEKDIRLKRRNLVANISQGPDRIIVEVVMSGLYVNYSITLKIVQ